MRLQNLPTLFAATSLALASADGKPTTLPDQPLNIQNAVVADTTGAPIYASKDKAIIVVISQADKSVVERAYKEVRAQSECGEAVCISFGKTGWESSAADLKQAYSFAAAYIFDANKKDPKVTSGTLVLSDPDSGKSIEVTGTIVPAGITGIYRLRNNPTVLMSHPTLKNKRPTP